MTVSFESRTAIGAPAELVFDLSRDVGEQVRGPFRVFRHEHRFEEHDGETVMIDRVEFYAPLGPIGRIVERIVLENYLRKLIEQRGAFLKRLAEQQL